MVSGDLEAAGSASVDGPSVPALLTRRRFLLGSLASAMALGLSTVLARAAHACDYGACYAVGWFCGWNGWRYDWFQVSDCFDSVTGEYCGQFWIDTGVPC